MTQARSASVVHPGSSSPHPSLAIVYHDIDRLTADPENPRIHSKKQIKKLVASIRAFGFNVPLLIDGNGKLIAGHGRLQAAAAAGMTRVPTIQLEHLTAEQTRAFMIADNHLTELSVWDDSLLAKSFKALAEVDISFDLEATGFEMGEIDFLIENSESVEERQDDLADQFPESRAEAISKTGDCWLLGNHRILCGNALESASYVPLMEGGRAQMAFTDPPYNVRIHGHATGNGKTHHREFAMASGEMSSEEFAEFLTKMARQMAEHTLPGSLHYLCMDWRHLEELLKAGRQVYSELKNLCVWVKNNGGMGSLYRSQHELVVVYKNGTAEHQNNIQLGKFGRTRTNVWRYPGANSFGRSTNEGNLRPVHPTIKPVALVADAILDCTGRGDIVLDPFCGSGTTIIAAERTGRRCFALEIDPLYVDTIVLRWQTFVRKTAVHATSHRSFAEIEKEVNRERAK
jgi:DNA modification methylase